MRKVIAAATAVAALALASPAFAIHDLPLDADDCAPGHANAVGDPSVAAGNPTRPNTTFSNTVLAARYRGDPNCSATGRPF
jgi:hypothetical protein